tara:strand:- start:3995 stop:4168 length:174 start_codon:yes stop_codon:yes gene_type:complete
VQIAIRASTYERLKNHVEGQEVRPLLVDFTTNLIEKTLDKIEARDERAAVAEAASEA